MTIKADHWIARMAREHGMIEPFEPQQVRASPSGERVISYGLSSYGYDIRVADEFKIFTPNPYNTVVDPKAIDPRAFQDFKGDVCIIPPNSYALCRSLEYFRVPKDVLVVVLGKSTYARCFRGDTRVALVDGRAPTLEDMARRYEDGELFWGYSIGPTGRLIVTLLDKPRYIGRDALVEIALDNGEIIHCTPDHKLLRHDGQFEAACKLRPGDSLMPLYRDLFRGYEYEMVYQPLDGHLYPRHVTFQKVGGKGVVRAAEPRAQSPSPRIIEKIPTHCLADERHIRNGMYEDTPNTPRHHVDHSRRNKPWNIVRVDASEHIRYHNRETFGDDFDPIEHGAAIQDALRQRYPDDEWYAARLLNCDRPVFRRFPEVRRFKGQSNHKIAAIRELPGDHDVYCLTVPEAGNFALEAGVFAQNCGIIVNVTPGEPGWEGFWTIEISNAAPLPAKIYANEGIAQCLFFQSDSLPTISYADREGKYQGQRGITLPRI